MSSKTTRKKIVSKEILEQAAQVFATKGYANSSLQDVADAVGLSRPALYYYYSSKTALLEALVQDVSVSGASILAKIRNNKKLDPEQRVRVAAENLVLWALDRPLRFKVIDRSEDMLPEEISKTHEAAKRQVLRTMTNLISDGVEAGVLRPLQPHIAALSVIGMCNWTAWWWTPSSPQSKPEVAKFIGEMAISAMRRVGPNRSTGTRIEDAIELLRNDLDFLEIVAGSK